MRRRLLHFLAANSLAAVSLVSSVQSAVVSFGSGPNVFQMEFVTIGNPNNAADTTGSPNPAGAVGYTYDIGKFEVSEDMITKFNASQSLQITKDTRGVNKPATSIAWNEAARFVNWLNTSTGGFAAYKFTTSGVNDNIALWTSSDTLDYDSSNSYRSIRAKYVLPSYNEWHKAAYYDPNKSIVAGYWDYATGSDSAPTAVTGGTDAGTAVYDQDFFQGGPADVNQAGGLSPYGVMGLGGNAFEWEESSFDLANSNGSSSRGIRGGHWLGGSNSQSSSARQYDGFFFPDLEINNIGFRVATNGGSGGGVGGGEVPEPSTLAIFGLGALGMAFRSRRRKST